MIFNVFLYELFIKFYQFLSNFLIFQLQDMEKLNSTAVLITILNIFLK